jgi:hypothetical protein
MQTLELSHKCRFVLNEYGGVWVEYADGMSGYVGGDIDLDATKAREVITFLLKAFPELAPKPLTEVQIQDATTKAVRERKLSWLGFKKDDQGEYTIPSLSPSAYQMVRVVEAAHNITGA